MIIRTTLLLLAIALSVLLSADAMLALTIPVLPELMTQIGLALLLVGFGLLLTSGLLVLSQLTLASFKEYFSSSQRLQRKQLFSAAHQQQLKQLLLFKTAYIAYFNELRRKRLLAANNRQHIKALSKTIDRHLKTSKLTLPRPTYRQWRQENRRYKHLQDANALLQLQQKIEALEKS